jgi:predicted ATP-grasp superfamily ATP-dependent carboligase
LHYRYPADAVTNVSRPPVLLTMADWYGTLAAVRELGRRGIEVYVASHRRFTRAGSSKYASRRLSCPDERDTAAFTEWLLDLGYKRPGLALCPTSDEIAWLYAYRAGELKDATYRLSPQPVEAMCELLDKARLHAQAERVGLATPRTFLPHDAADAERLAQQLGGGVLVKPRTQIGTRLSKGVALRDATKVRATYADFQRKNAVDGFDLRLWPDADKPMLQEYLPSASSRIYYFSGFIAPCGERWATRAAWKVLSHPRYLGIGLLFEHTEVDPDLEHRVLQMCRNVGYHGVFGCEFLEHEGRLLLIDFNPRFYNQTAFDHARGLPQAWLSYLLACGALDELEIELERARVVPSSAAGTVFAYRLGASAQLLLERLSGAAGANETARWRRWRSQARTMVDPVAIADDRLPGVVDLAEFARGALRHPRNFWLRHTRRPY